MTGPEILALVPWPAAAAVLALAGLVHGLFGIGFPLVATPLLALLTDVRTAVVLTLLSTVAVNLGVLVRGAGQGVRIGAHRRLVPFVVAGTLLGAVLLSRLDPRPFLLVLAAALLLYLNGQRLRGVGLGWVRTRTGLAYGVFGTLAGLMAGSVNVMVPVLIIFALELRLAPALMVQVFNLNFLVAKCLQVVVFLALGLVTPGALGVTLGLVPAALLGLAAGLRLRRRLGEDRGDGWYPVALRGLLWLMTGVLVVRFFQG
jgi:uncharacterized membrane protein YfcA